MTTMAVTGATGLVGSNVARLLREQGHEVRALVRPGSPATELVELGVHIVEGDVTVRDSVVKAVDGAEFVVHSAALLGGANQRYAEHLAVNLAGARNVYDAAKEVGVGRVVTLSTRAFFLADHQPLTERSPIDPRPKPDPYTQTKLRAYLEAMRRVDGEGHNIVVVISGMAYGPAPMVARSMVAPSSNQRIVDAVRGRLSAYVAYPMPWVLAEDVAAMTVAALTHGDAGERFLAFGHPEDAQSIPSFCNIACELAGVAHRVEEIDRSRLEDPAVIAEVGQSLANLARRDYPVPLFDNSHTLDTLGHAPRRVRAGIETTLRWLGEHRLL